jgi:hypothetical protein
MLTRVRRFERLHGDLLPGTTAARAAFATVATEVDRLEALAVAEQTATQTSRAGGKAAARQILADALTRAGLTARVLAKTNPQLQARIELPLPNDDQLLISVARHFAAGAAAAAELFAAHGIPVTELEACITGLERALEARQSGRDDYVKTRAEIAASFGKAMDAVEALDVMVANCLRAHRGVVAVWNHDRRFERRRRPARRMVAPLDDGSHQASVRGGLQSAGVIGGEAAGSSPAALCDARNPEDGEAPDEETLEMVDRRRVVEAEAFPKLQCHAVLPPPSVTDPWCPRSPAVDEKDGVVAREHDGEQRAPRRRRRPVRRNWEDGGCRDNRLCHQDEHDDRFQVNRQSGEERAAPQPDLQIQKRPDVENQHVDSPPAP